MKKKMLNKLMDIHNDIIAKYFNPDISALIAYESPIAMQIGISKEIDQIINDKMTPQEINSLQTFLGSGYEVKQVGNVALIEKVKEPIRVNISAYDLCHSHDMRIRFSINKERSKSFDWDNEELANHIEESIEAFLNRKP